MNALIVGLGSMGKKHISALKALLPEVKIFALRSRNPGEQYLDVRNIVTLQDITNVNLDFCIISNPTANHKETIESLLHLNVPMFIEKPISHTLEIEDLVSEIVDKNIVTYVACNLRFLDCLIFVKQCVDEKKFQKINEINVYCGSYLPDWRIHQDYLSSYSASMAAGGGVHLDLIHELDYLYWIFGEPQNISKRFRNYSSLGISSYDYANYFLDYGSFAAGVILNYYRRDPVRGLELVFEDKTWKVDLLNNEICCDGKKIFRSSQAILDTYEAQMKYFINCLADNQKPMNSIADGLQVLSMAL